MVAPGPRQVILAHLTVADQFYDERVVYWQE